MGTLLMLNQSCVSYVGSISCDGLQYTVEDGYRVGAAHSSLYDMLVRKDYIPPSGIVNLYKIYKPFTIDMLDVAGIYSIDDVALGQIEALYNYRKQGVTND